LFTPLLSPSHTCHMFHPSLYSGFNHPNNIRSEVQTINLFIMQSPPAPSYLIP
jgi:hypothetical protein